MASCWSHDGDVDGVAQLEGGDEKQTNIKSEMHFNPKDLQQSCRGEKLQLTKVHPPLGPGLPLLSLSLS